MPEVSCVRGARVATEVPPSEVTLPGASGLVAEVRSGRRRPADEEELEADPSTLEDAGELPGDVIDEDDPVDMEASGTTLTFPGRSRSGEEEEPLDGREDERSDLEEEPDEELESEEDPHPEE